jgi:hypothetical protein
MYRTVSSWWFKHKEGEGKKAFGKFFFIASSLDSKNKYLRFWFAVNFLPKRCACAGCRWRAHLDRGEEAEAAVQQQGGRRLKPYGEDQTASEAPGASGLLNLRSVTEMHLYWSDSFPTYARHFLRDNVKG